MRVPRTEYNRARRVRGGVSDVTVSNGVNLVANVPGGGGGVGFRL